MQVAFWFIPKTFAALKEKGFFVAQDLKVPTRDRYGITACRVVQRPPCCNPRPFWWHPLSDGPHKEQHHQEQASENCYGPIHRQGGRDRVEAPPTSHEIGTPTRCAATAAVVAPP